MAGRQGRGRLVAKRFQLTRPPHHLLARAMYGEHTLLHLRSAASARHSRTIPSTFASQADVGLILDLHQEDRREGSLALLREASSGGHQGSASFVD